MSRRTDSRILSIAPDADHILIVLALVLALCLPLLGSLGCESAPGDEPEQGAVVGGAAGAAAGAAVAGEGDRLEGALIGGLLGAGGGYIVGSEIDKRREEEAREAAERARQNPATADQARAAATADIDGNGFVTVDEVVALERAGLSDDEIIQRLRATGQVFPITDRERQQLREGGVSDDVINRMPEINREKLGARDDDDGRISQDRDD